MTKQEAVRILEETITDKKYDREIRGFVNLYHQGAMHKMVQQRGVKISEIIAMAETKVDLPEEVKSALNAIFK